MQTFKIILNILLVIIQLSHAQANDQNFGSFRPTITKICYLSNDLLSYKVKTDKWLLLADTLKYPKKVIDSLSTSLNNSGVSADTLTISKHSIYSLKLKVDSMPRRLQGEIMHLYGNAPKGGDSVVNMKQDKFNEVREKIEEKERKILKANVQNKLKNFPAAIPVAHSVDITQVEVQSSEIDFSGIQSPSSIPDIPEIKLPSIGIPKTKAPLEQMNVLHQQSQNTVNKFKTVEEYKHKIAETKVDSITDRDKLAQQTEKSAERLTKVKALTEGTNKLTSKQAEYEAMMQHHSDKKLVEEDIRRKIRNVANDKVNQLTPAIDEAQNALLKGKKILKDSASLKVLKRTMRDAMASEPVAKRIVTGVMLQLYNRRVYSVDVDLHIGYCLSGKITTGIGGVYRFGYHKDYSSYIRSMHVYGGRVYGDVIVKKGFFVHGEAELLRSKDMIFASKEEVDDYVLASSLGIGKQYTLSKRLRGRILLLYRAEVKGHLPEQNKINLRVGLALSAKRKRII
ncbi:hypothetical protein [Ohtaekwangia koreensis]|uniref:Uncharacterized protein n=1 Tax=Ohtaekwangia koreensis TaxID=688867 RepID=A0A1T5MBF0_9BACT|nr:hypothetical protein [Ohtaekwangia koreensis]SKC85188.1 hypothetical protein SAMN05660236_4854 [Ohtaekwangia koreensis]